MVKSEKNKMPKLFYIGFEYTPDSFLPILAKNSEEAKLKFVIHKGVRLSSFVVSKNEKYMKDRIKKLTPIV